MKDKSSSRSPIAQTKVGKQRTSTRRTQWRMTAMTKSESERQNLLRKRKPSRSVKSDRSNPVGFEGFATLPGSMSNGILEPEHSRPSPAALCSNRGCYLTQEGGSHASGVEQSLTGHGTAQCHELDPQDLKNSLPAYLLGDSSEILPPTCSIVYNVHDCVSPPITVM